MNNDALETFDISSKPQKPMPSPKVLPKIPPKVINKPLPVIPKVPPKPNQKEEPSEKFLLFTPKESPRERRTLSVETLKKFMLPEENLSETKLENQNVYVALYDFRQKDETQLSFKKNDVIVCIDESLYFNDFKKGLFDNRIGFFPKSFVELLETPDTTITERENKKIEPKKPTWTSKSSVIRSGKQKAKKISTSSKSKLMKYKFLELRSWDTLEHEVYGDFSQLVGSVELRELIRKEGVPEMSRSQVWYDISGAKNLKDQCGTYEEIMAIFKGAKSKATDQIEKDLARTGEALPSVRELLKSPEGSSMLRRVLSTYSFLHPDIGYCQSMNFIAGIFFLYFSEESCFWLLSTVIEHILPQHYYSDSLVGIRVDELVFHQLFDSKLPNLSDHFDECDFEIKIFTVRWFMCLFLDYLPQECSLRLMDLIFSEGDKVLFRCGLAILKLYEQDLLNCTNGSEIMDFISKTIPSQIQPDPLIKTCFSLGKFHRRKLKGLRIWAFHELQKT